MDISNNNILKFANCVVKNFYLGLDLKSYSEEIERLHDSLEKTQTRVSFQQELKTFVNGPFFNGNKWQKKSPLNKRRHPIHACLRPSVLAVPFTLSLLILMISIVYIYLIKAPRKNEDLSRMMTATANSCNGSIPG